MIEIEPGDYIARAVTGDLGVTSTGKDQIWIEFKLKDQDETIRWYGYFTERSIGITTRALKTCGWTGTDVSDLSGIGDNDVSLKIIIDDYDGRAKVNWVNEIGGTKNTSVTRESAISDADKKSMAKRIAQKMKKIKKETDDVPW